MSTKNVPKEIRDLLKEVAAEMELEYDIVEDIYYHEFEFTAAQIASGEKDNYSTFENILIKHFGSFIASERHVDKLKEINENKRKREEDCIENSCG
jgi:triphosphoribosyl-dephospho-CoA synthetase